MIKHIGLKLWYVPSDEREHKWAKEVTVTAIGRKWATLDSGQRIDLETLRADGGKYASPGKCWLCRGDWEEFKKAHELQSELVRRLTCTPNEGVTCDHIRHAARLLQVPLPS